MDANTEMLTEAKSKAEMLKYHSPHGLTHAIGVSRARQTSLLTV